MNNQQQKDKKNRIMAAAYTLGVHAAIFILMFFIIAWRVPNPPFPGSGIELNFGMDTEGSGDIQPEEPVGTDKVQSEQKSEDAKQEETKEQKEETPVVKQEVKPIVTKPQDEELVTSHEESPVVVKEKKEEPKKEEVKKPVEKIEDKPKVEEKPLAIYKPGGKTEDKSKTVGKEGKPGNQGDDKDKVGDKGNPQGTLDSKAMYGNPGNGNGGSGGNGGFGLNMVGWAWDQTPNKPELPDNESGFVIFEITVDDQGAITGIVPVEKTLSPEAVRLCRLEILKRSLVRTAGGDIPSFSKGRVRYDLRVK